MGFSWNIKKAGYRVYQEALGVGVKLINFPNQLVLSGNGTLVQAADILKKQGAKSVFITCSRSVHRHGLMDGMLAALDEGFIKYTIFEDINANPTTANVDAGYELYKANGCDSIITIGGGSPMDCAKGIGLRVTNPELSYEDMRSMLKIHHRVPFMIAVPTTAGTGSESTVAAVISNPEKHDKYAIVSPKLMPHCVILDAGLTTGLPADFTAYTGMDALTHAIEAYIGIIDTKLTDREALRAIKLTLKYLSKAFDTPNDLEAREKMLVASNKAGIAFTRVYVGYVHSFSHAMSALYNVGHGKTNAIILPYMLDFYGASIYKKMGEIARYCGIKGDSDKELCEKLIATIRSMNERFGIPTYVEEISESDIDTIVKKALHEGNPGYPVPKIMNYDEGVELVKKLMKK